MRPLAFFALLLLASLAGCSLVNPDDVVKLGNTAELSIHTEQEVYRVEGDGLSIPVTLENKSNSSIYLSYNLGDPSFVVEKQIGGAWVMVYHPVVTADLKPPREMEAGEEISSTFWLSHLKDRKRPYWEPVVDTLAGTYRFVVMASTERGKAENDYQREFFPLDRRASRPFEIVE